FALEPHTETLRLRGRILRHAGRYPAAEVAFEGAAQAAEHPEQREEAEREILATRRYAFYAPRRPDQLTPSEQWFAQTGVAALAAARTPPGPRPRRSSAPASARAPMAGKAIAHSQFDRAANLINLESYLRRILLAPFREVQVEVPVRMDDGHIEVFTGYRIQ